MSSDREAGEGRGGRAGWIFHNNNGEPLYHYLPSRPPNRRLIPEVKYRLIGNRAAIYSESNKRLQHL